MEVLIVGAGPVGLMAAHELLRRNVRVRLVDAAAGPATTSRAAAIHARTMEMLDQVGLYEAFAERAVRGTGIAFHADGTELASMDAKFTVHATRFNQVWFLDQVITEQLLRDAVMALGGRIEWNVRLTGLKQHDDGVTATLTHRDGRTEECAVPRLIGADGAHSQVRRELGVHLQGEGSETWLIADAELTFATPMPHDRIRWVRTDGSTTMIFPLVGQRRWRLLDTDGADRFGSVDLTDVTTAEAIARRFADKLTRGLGTEVAVDTPSWISVFTIQQRVVPTMHNGRCFLAGDAAHVHSPASGQGLNTGLQDAVNLAWKLAAVIHGEAAPALLDTYSAERVPVGQSLLGSTRMATMLVTLRNPIVDEHLPAVFNVINALPPVLQAMTQGFLGGMSGLGVSYSDSSLTVHDTDTTRPGPRPGQRVAQVRADTAVDAGWQTVLGTLRNTKWALLTGPDGAPAAPRWATAQPVGGIAAQDLGLTGGSWLLVRPDGYVAARGNGQTQLEDAVRRMPL